MLYLLNGITSSMLEGNLVVIRKISANEARRIISKNRFFSAIGHKGNAELMTKILGIKVDYNRVMVKLFPFDKAIVFQPIIRLPEGAVLTAEELAKIPCGWFLVCVYPCSLWGLLRALWQQFLSNIYRVCEQFLNIFR